MKSKSTKAKALPRLFQHVRAKQHPAYTCQQGGHGLANACHAGSQISTRSLQHAEGEEAPETSIYKATRSTWFQKSGRSFLLMSFVCKAVQVRKSRVPILQYRHRRSWSTVLTHKPFDKAWGTVVEGPSAAPPPVMSRDLPGACSSNKNITGQLSG